MTPWSELAADEKRTRLLSSAAELLARDGLEATMPDIAAAAGAGVASLYRCFPSKQELISALVVRRLDEVRDTAVAAGEPGRDPREALIEMLWVLAAQQAADDLFGVAYAAVADRPAVAAAKARTTAALGAVLDRARECGSVRGDLTTDDLHLLFVLTRASRIAAPDAWRRVLELFIDAFAVSPAPLAAP